MAQKKTKNSQAQKLKTQRQTVKNEFQTTHIQQHRRTRSTYPYVSNLANANHMLTEVGTHSTARLNIMRASSSSSSNEIAASHNLTEFGIVSNARRRTIFSWFVVAPLGPRSR